MQPRLNTNVESENSIITHPKQIVEAVEGIATEGVEVGGDVVESEGPDHGACEELPGAPALANVSSNIWENCILENIKSFTFV